MRAVALIFALLLALPVYAQGTGNQPGPGPAPGCPLSGCTLTGSFSALSILNTPISGSTGSFAGLTATSINGNTITTGTGTLTLAAGKTLTANNTLTFSGTDSSTLNIGAGGTLGSNAYTSTAYAPLASPTFTGTVTLPDACNWTTTGVSCSGSYTTSNQTPVLNFQFTDNYAATGTKEAMYLNATMTPTGASSGSTIGLRNQLNFTGGSVNIGTARGIYDDFVQSAGYTGTITTYNGIEVTGGAVAGNAIGTWNGIKIDAPVNGNGTTSGTVTDNTLNLAGASALAGAGGTVNSTVLTVAMPSGTNAGTMTATGISITGNGVTGATSTNYAINSTSTAQSVFSGTMSASGYLVGATAGLASKSCTINTANAAAGIVLTITGGLITGTTTC